MKCLIAPRMGIYDLLNIESNKVQPPSLPAMTVILRCPQETKPIYPVSVVTSILESKQEAGHKYLTWSLPTSCFRKCKQGGGCECLAWGPFESLRIEGLHIATGHSVGRSHESSWEEVGIKRWKQENCRGGKLFLSSLLGNQKAVWSYLILF